MIACGHEFDSLSILNKYTTARFTVKLIAEKTLIIQTAYIIGHVKLLPQD